MDLKLHDSREKESVRLAEHVLADSTGRLLGFPEGFRTWRRDVVINFIIPVKNQAKWVKYFLLELAKVYELTGDENFHVIMIDFESADEDIGQVLEESSLAGKSTLLKKSGPFHKTLALTDAVDSVNDPNSIVFLFDLHITVPVMLLNLVRTVSGLCESVHTIVEFLSSFFVPCLLYYSFIKYTLEVFEPQVFTLP